MSVDLFDMATSGAKFSQCGTYRYILYRIWDKSKPFIMFIGLNPSTATAEMDDPTIRRVKRFANDWGYGGVYMCNLFAVISPYPETIVTCSDPIADNDLHLQVAASKCKDVLFAWGSFTEAEARAKEVIKMFPNAFCLGKNKDGSPKHPLYIKANTKPFNYFYMKNREISFNAWIPKLSVMLETVTVHTGGMIGMHFDDFKTTVEEAGHKIDDDEVVDKDGNKLMELMQGEDYVFIDDIECVTLQYSGYEVKGKAMVYEGDIVELKNEDGKKITAVCEYGRARRNMAAEMDQTIRVDIEGFYFKLSDGKKTFPIVENYAGKHDLSIMKKVGNIFQNPALFVTK
jgi:hypothetical protein